VLTASALIGGGVLLGRVAGLAREIVLSASIGAGGDADVAVLVLTFPDLLTTILIGGVVSAVLVPDFTLARARALSGRTRFWSLEIVAAASALVVAIGMVLAAPVVTRILGPGLPTARLADAAPLVAVAAATLPFSALAAVSTAYLQAHGRFAVPAAGTLLFNTALVTAIVFFVHPGLLLPIAVAAVVGSVIRWLSQILATRAVHDVGPPAGLRHEELPRLVTRYLQALAATGLVVLVPYVARTIASLGEPGDIAVLTYASRIVELPLGAFLTVGSIALLPHISERFAIGDREGALRLGQGGLVATSIVAVPLTVALIWAAYPIALVLFGRGATSPEAVSRIADLARVTLVTLPAQGAAALLTAFFVARRRLSIVVIVNGLGVAAFLIVALALESLLGVLGVAVAFAGLHWALAIALLIVLGFNERLHLSASGVMLDILMAATIGMAVFSPVMLLDQAALGIPGTIALACVAGAAALIASLFAPYRNLPRGTLLVRSLLGSRTLRS